MTVALALAAALSALVWTTAFLFLRLDRNVRGLGVWLVATAAWGAAVPAGLASVAALLPDLLAEPAVGAAIPELWLARSSTAVALALVGLALPVIVAARSRLLDGPSAGAVVGVTAAVAFSAGMHLLVAVRSAWRPPAGALVFVALFHAGIGALLGAGVGLAKLAASRALRAPAVACAVATAGAFAALLSAGARAAWGRWGEANPACNGVLALAAAVSAAGVFVAAVACERRVLAAQLAEEVALGVLPSWVTGVVPSYRRRARSDWWGRSDERREIVGLLLALAFRKRRLRTLAPDRARLYGLEVGRLRQRAKALVAMAEPPAAAGPERVE